LYIGIALAGALVVLIVVGWLKGMFLRFRGVLTGDQHDPVFWLFGVMALTAAFRLAHPASRWAGWFYGPERFTKAEGRYLGIGTGE
jgi:hypothetical protein